MGRGDHAELVAALRHEPWPGDSLQLIGDGLLAALCDGTDGWVDPAQACVTALHEREWDGDRELADALIAALGTGPTPMLRPLPACRRPRLSSTPARLIQPPTRITVRRVEDAQELH